MSRRISAWLAGLDVPARPPLDDVHTCDVVVIGGGVAGLTTALMLQRSGASVALVEAERVAHGTSGNTTGKVSSQHGVTYASLVDQHGEDKARAYADANQAAIATVADLANEIGDATRFTPTSSFVYVMSPSKRKKLEREHEAATALGLPAHLTTETDLPFEVELALRFDDQAYVDVGPYLFGLADLFEAAGGSIFEGTRATDVDESREGVTVALDTGGSVNATHAVQATLIPFMDRGGFFARMKPVRAYGVAARVSEPVLENVHIGAGSPTRSTRPWTADNGSPGIVVVGENHVTGHETATPARWGELERWAGDHFDVVSFDYRWSAQDFTTIDDLPYVGLSPMMKRTFVATGFRKWGLTNATAAAGMLTDLIEGRQPEHFEAFDASRIGTAEAIKEFAKRNAHVAKRFIEDRLARLKAPPLDDIGRGEGSIVRHDGRAMGVYRDPQGICHAVSATCTHLGCTVAWNDAEKSWDCPCHGSRFDIDGSVLDGPAVDPLDQIEV